MRTIELRFKVKQLKVKQQVVRQNKIYDRLLRSIRTYNYKTMTKLFPNELKSNFCFHKIKTVCHFETASGRFRCQDKSSRLWQISLIFYEPVSQLYYNNINML